MTGGTKTEWDGLAKELSAARSRCQACNGNKFIDSHSGLVCEVCGAIKGVYQGGTMSGGMEESAWTYGNPSFELRTGAKDSEDQKKSALNSQIGGDHYAKLKIQPIEYIHANNIPFAEGCAIKYLTRWRDKNGLDDLHKARHFVDLLIELESKR